MKQLFFLLLLFFATPLYAQESIYHNQWIDFNKNGQKDIYEDPKQEIEQRIEDLLSQMNVDEKTCQTATLYGFSRVLKDELPNDSWYNEVWKDGIANIDEHLNGLARHPRAKTVHSYPFQNHAEAINTVQKWFVEETRLGIPVDFSNEGIHGLTHDRATPLPAPINIGSTWNKELVYKAGEMVGQEAKALGYTNIYAPILDVARDPRWGRVVECYGEDPFLVASLGVEMTKGIQSNNVGSTLKHYAVYGIPKGGRDGNARTDAHVAPRELHQIHLYPFREVIQQAQPKGIMCSYNDWDGIPIASSHYFLTELLRNQYGFSGYMVSDSRAVKFVEEKHRVAKDYKEAVEKVIEAGLDVRTGFTPPEDYILPLRELIDENQVSMETLNKHVRNVLRVKFELGLFDRPYVEDVEEANSIVANESHMALSEEINRQSMVLLKNVNQLLPLDPSAEQTILVTGPLAKATDYAISRYGPSNHAVTSVYEGIRNYLGSEASILYEKGCEVRDEQWPQSELMGEELTAEEQAEIEKAVEKAKKSNLVIAVMGEDISTVGESLSRTSLDLPGKQRELLKALHRTGTPIVLVLINGRPLTINWENERLPAILEAWFPGPQSGKVIAETLFGEHNPGGKLPMTFPKSVGQIQQNFPFKPASQAGQPQSGPNGSGVSRVVGNLYPFGYGLSYTNFEYSNLVVTPQFNEEKKLIQVSVDVTNAGKRAGDEVVQLYVQDPLSSVIVYEQVLRGFERIHLDAGETKTVHFTIEPKHLSLLDETMNEVVEAGEFSIRVGSSSEDIRLMESISITEPIIL